MVKPSSAGLIVTVNDTPMCTGLPLAVLLLAGVGLWLNLLSRLAKHAAAPFPRSLRWTHKYAQPPATVRGRLWTATFDRGHRLMRSIRPQLSPYLNYWILKRIVADPSDINYFPRSHDFPTDECVLM